MYLLRAFFLRFALTFLCLRALCCSKMQFYSCQGNLTPSAKMPKPYDACLLPPRFPHTAAPAAVSCSACLRPPPTSQHPTPNALCPSLVFCLRCASFWLTIKCQDIPFFHSIVLFFFFVFFVLRHLQPTTNNFHFVVAVGAACVGSKCVWYSVLCIACKA